MDGTSYVQASVWWLSLMLINAGLAQSKGRSRWNWFLFSFLLGPFATFLIVTWERGPLK